MIWYSLLLTLGLLIAAPWWLWRMASSGRYREGLAQRLGHVPPALRAAVFGRQVIWIHAVSVGEVLAIERLVHELRSALGDTWVIALSTTTATGQKIARQRLGPRCPVFFFPLDLAFAVRPWLRVLNPRLMILVESEFWPRHLHECERARIPVAVVNARVSDRSLPRYLRLRRLWQPLLAKVALFLAQSEESANRLRQIGAPAVRIHTPGNLKYDLPQTSAPNAIAQRIQLLAHGRKIVVAGSTVTGEEAIVLQAWRELLTRDPEALLVLAPRHPQRFREVEKLARDTASGLQLLAASSEEFHHADTVEGGAVILLDTLGDLAAVYELASVAFIGGSLVPKGGHNPLEAARFGVPIIMGPSYENFREVVDGMRSADALRIADPTRLGGTIAELLRDDQGTGRRAQAFFESQSGATARTVQAVLELLHA